MTLDSQAKNANKLGLLFGHLKEVLCSGSGGAPNFSFDRIGSWCSPSLD